MKKLYQRILSMVLSLSMLLSMGVTAGAEYTTSSGDSDIAKLTVGENTYYFQNFSAATEALADESLTGEKTLTLLQNITLSEDVTVSSADDLTIQLNGCTMSATKLAFSVKGTVSISDEKQTGGISVQETSDWKAEAFEISGGVFAASGRNSHITFKGDEDYNSTASPLQVTLSGGSYTATHTSNNTYGALYFEGVSSAPVNASVSNVTVESDGSGSSPALSVGSYAEVTINSGSFTASGKTNAVIYNNASNMAQSVITVENGTYTATAAAGEAVGLSTYGYCNEIWINGGVFNGNITCPFNMDQIKAMGSQAGMDFNGGIYMRGSYVKGTVTEADTSGMQAVVIDDAESVYHGYTQYKPLGSFTATATLNGTGATLTPSGTVTVHEGEAQTYTLTVQDDYELTAATYQLQDGDKQDILEWLTKNDNSYTYSVETKGNYTITFTVAKKTSTEKVAAVTKSDGSKVEYTLLSDAISALADGDTLSLLADVTRVEPISIETSGSVTIDLNGHTLTTNSPANEPDPSKAAAISVEGGTLTLRDTVGGGKIDASMTGVSLYSDETMTFVLESGTIDGAQYGVFSGPTATSGKARLTGGTVTSVGVPVMMTSSQGELEISGDVTIEAAGAATANREARSAVSFAAAKLTVTGGHLTSADAVLRLANSSGSVSVTGGTLQSTAGDGIYVYMQTGNSQRTGGGNAEIISNTGSAIYLKDIASQTLTIEGDAALSGKDFAIDTRQATSFTGRITGGYFKGDILPIDYTAAITYTDGKVMDVTPITDGEYTGYYTLVDKEDLSGEDENGLPQTYQNFDDLNNAISNAEALDKELYTELSYKAVTDALAIAKAVKANQSANQMEIDYYTQPLVDAILSVVPISEANLNDKPDGTYSIAVTLLNSSDNGGFSMANGAIVHTAELTLKDGVQTLKFRLNPLLAAGLWGHTEDVWLYEGDSLESAFVNARSENPTLIPLEELSWYTDEDDNGSTNSATQGDAGAFPHDFQLTLPYFALDEYKFLLRISIDVMNEIGVGQQSVILQLDYGTMKAKDVEPTLKLDTTEVSLLQSDSQTAKAEVLGADGYTLSVNSENPAVATAAIEGGTITITAVGAGTANITVTATNGSDTLTKTIAVTVAGSGSTAVGVSTPEVSDNTATATIFGDTIVTNGSSDKVTVTEDEITFDVKASSTSVDKAMVTLNADTADALEKSGKDVVIETDVGSVSLDAALLDTVAGKNAAVTLTVAEATMPIGIGSFEAAYDLILTANNTAIDFGSGKATVTVATELTSGYAYHIKDGKRVEKLPLTIVDGTASWTATHFSTWALSANEYNVDSGSGNPGGNPGGEEYFLKDGNYYVDIDLWKASSNEASMGNVAFKNNGQALVTVKNSEVTTVQIATNPVDVDQYHSAIIKFEVPGSSVTIQEKGSLTTEPAGKTYQYIKRAKFTMPSEGQPDIADAITYVAVEFMVPDTPMDAVVGETLEARLKFTWSSASATSDSSLEQDDSSAAGTSSITGEEIVDVDLVDKDTGIKLSTDSERLSDTATLSVEKLTSGSDYDTAVKAMTGITDSWSLYNITALVDGEVTAPEGSVTLSIPCTADGLTVYRINASGTKTVLKGEVKDGYYVLNTSSLGLFAIVGALGEARELPFTDVETGSWYYDGVKYAVEKGLFAGTSATTFAPNMELTRSMLVTVLYRLAGSPEVSQSENFSDVQADSWYEDAVTWAAANGVVAGYGGGVFGPDDDITREQLAVILYRYAQLTEQDVDTETDLTAYADAGEVSDFAREAMAWAVENGLINGTSKTTLSPKGTATRAQVAVILMRYLEQLNK